LAFFPFLRRAAGWELGCYLPPGDTGSGPQLGADGQPAELISPLHSPCSTARGWRELLAGGWGRQEVFYNSTMAQGKGLGFCTDVSCKPLFKIL